MAIEITTIDYTVPAEVYVAYGADFDTEGVDDAVLKELNALLPEGVSVARNGKVFAEKEAAGRARELDWSALLRGIDLDQILAMHAR